jgi:hypothetical protein
MNQLEPVTIHLELLSKLRNDVVLFSFPIHCHGLDFIYDSNSLLYLLPIDYEECQHQTIFHPSED